MGKLKKIGIGFAIFFAAMTILGMLLPDSDTPASTPSPTQIAAPTSAPTVRPTLRPTSEPSPTLGISEQRYLTAMAGHSARTSAAMETLGALLVDMRLFDQDWIIDVATELVSIRLLHDEAATMSAPQSMSKMHMLYTAGMGHYKEATYLFAKGIDTFDAALIDRAADQLEMGREFIGDATRLVYQFE